MQVAAIVWPGTLIPLGDRALTIDLSSVDDESLRGLVRSVSARLTAAVPGIVAVVPAIQSVTVHFDPCGIDASTLHDRIGDILSTIDVTPATDVEPLIIPVCYGGEYGPDLDDVAAAHATTPAAIVEAHTGAVYTVAMIGFLPGFPYLDGLARSLHTPRRSTPRTAVPAGSVGIGGSSTGIYPFTSPGGWHIIGRTPSTLFSPHRLPPALLQAGDRVRFTAITDAAVRGLTERA